MAELTLTPQRQRLFWIVLLAIPVLFFALFEGGLRLAGYGENTDLFVTVDWQGRQYYTINHGVTGRYFSDPGFSTYVSRDRFLVEKPAATYRIFVMGASTTVGFPYMFNGSVSSLLRDRIYARFPERHVEVVNLGITAVNSYTVADLTREALRYEPDLIIVYAGHNEFYGAFGVGSNESVGGHRWMVRLYLTAQRSKTFQLVRDGLRAVGGALAPSQAPGGQQLMERMARDREIAYGSPLYRRAQSYYQANLEDAIDAARARGVDVVMSTLVSNLRDQPPFVSVHPEGLSADDRARWQQLFDQGRAAATQQDHLVATRFYLEAVELDGERADGRFYLARSYEALGRYDDARAEYERARDLDALRFRASGEFNDVVRGVAASRDVPVVDMEAAFAEASPNGIPGATLFWEHVHPTFDGYLLMARALEQGMAVHGFLASAPEWASRPQRPDAFFRDFAGVTELDREVARLRIGLLMSRWPFRSDPVPFTYQSESPLQEVAWAYVRNEIGWATAHDRLAQAYRQAGDSERASDELWAIAKVTGYDPHYALAAADLDAANRRFGRAAERYAFAIYIRDEPLTRAKLGSALFEVGQYPEAAVHLERAIAVPGPPALSTPQRLHAHYLLGLAYLTQGDVPRAADQAERLRTLAPDAPPTRQLVATIAAASQARGVVIRRAEPQTPVAP
jgi:tetratricopeptide (TPR) repeat protein